MRTADIAVAGCGPGGLAAALLLARAGHRVTLFERFAAPCPVGSGLMVQPTGLDVLDRLGVGDTLRRLAAPIRGLHGLSMPSRRVALAMSYDALGPDVCALGTHRSLLFDALFHAVIASGLPLETSCRVEGSEADGARRRLRFDRGRRSPAFDLVVDAMGAHSPLAPPSRDLAFGALWTTLDRVPTAGVDADRLDQRYFHASQMAGIMPLGRSAPGAVDAVAYFWSLRTRDLDRWRRAGIEAWRDKALVLWPESAPQLERITAIEQFVFASYQHRTSPSPVAPALARIGDAWHATSPQLGQGANMALLDAEALAGALAADHSIPDALAAYGRRRRRHVRLYQAMSRVFTPAFQSESVVLPWLRDHLMTPLDRLAVVRGITARIVAGQIARPRPTPPAA